MGAALELLTRILILVNSTQDGNNLLFGRQRDGAGDRSAGALGGLYYLLCGLVDQLVIIRLQANANHFCFAIFGFSFIVVRFFHWLSKPYGEIFFSSTLILCVSFRLIRKPARIKWRSTHGAAISQMYRYSSRAARFSDRLPGSYLRSPEQSPGSSQFCTGVGRILPLAGPAYHTRYER